MRINLALIKILTIIYISFPLIPFFWGWSSWGIALPLSIVLIFSLFKYIGNLDYKIQFFVPKRVFWIILAIVLLWLLYSGAGGFGYQFHDHVKNNTLAKELSQKPWPLMYVVEGRPLYLTHYLSFYISGPFLVGFLGYNFVQLFVFCNTFLGVLLGVFWLMRYTGTLKWYFPVMFILFGGISIFSFLIKYRSGFITEIINRLNNHGYVFWANCWDIIPINYMGITDMLYWTPQHFIPAIIGIGVLLNDAFIDNDIKYTPFFLSLLVMWSPMILLGIAPFLIFVFVAKRFKGVFNTVNLFLAMIIFLYSASYLLAIESQELVKHFIFTDLSSQHISLGEQIMVYLYFLIFEVVVWIFVIVVSGYRKLVKTDQYLLIFTAVLLCLIPLYRLGLWNDWSNRISMPSIILLFVLLFKSFELSSKKGKLLVGVLLVLSSTAAFIDIGGSLKYCRILPRFDPPDESLVQDLPTICVSYPLAQFVAKDESFFYKHFAKKPDNYQELIKK